MAFGPLTEREYEIVLLMAKHLSNREMGDRGKAVPLPKYLTIG